jgi:hypothetical protein
MEGERAARELKLTIKNTGVSPAQLQAVSARAVLQEYGSPARENPKYDEVRGHARLHGAQPKNRNFAHVTLVGERLMRTVGATAGRFKLHHSTATLPKWPPLTW